MSIRSRGARVSASGIGVARFVTTCFGLRTDAAGPFAMKRAGHAAAAARGRPAPPRPTTAPSGQAPSPASSAQPRRRPATPDRVPPGGPPRVPILHSTPGVPERPRCPGRTPRAAPTRSARPSRRQQMTSVTSITSAFRPRRRLADLHRGRLTGHEHVPALPVRQLVEALVHVAGLLVGLPAAAAPRPASPSGPAAEPAPARFPCAASPSCSSEPALFSHCGSSRHP